MGAWLYLSWQYRKIGGGLADAENFNWTYRLPGTLYLVVLKGATTFLFWDAISWTLFIEQCQKVGLMWKHLLHLSSSVTLSDFHRVRSLATREHCLSWGLKFIRESDLNILPPFHIRGRAKGRTCFSQLPSVTPSIHLLPDDHLQQMCYRRRHKWSQPIWSSWPNKKRCFTPSLIKLWYFKSETWTGWFTILQGLLGSKVSRAQECQQKLQASESIAWVSSFILEIFVWQWLDENMFHQALLSFCLN